MLKMIGLDWVLPTIGYLYLLLMLAAICIALWRGKTRLRKFIWALGLFALFMAPVAPEIYRSNAYAQRVTQANKLFEERCKTTGERIYRTVEEVDGVLLTKIRATSSISQMSDRDWADAALPLEGRGDDYIRTFLYWEHHEDKRMTRGYLNEQPSGIRGYKFVDAADASGVLFRYRLAKPGSPSLLRERLQGTPARYAVSFENSVNVEERKKWIAGTRVRIVDTATQKLLAEKTWFAIEPGQGNTDGFRTPWSFAKTCPEVRGWAAAPTRFFADQILKPIQD